MLYPSVFAFVTAALVVAANPVVVPRSPISLPFAKVISTTGTTSLIEQDRARIQALKARAQLNTSQNATEPVDVPVTNQVVSYIASVGVGTPPTSYNLIIDTGSSTTWAGANTSNPLVTSSGAFTGNLVAVSYGSGQFEGLEYNDTVTIGSLDIDNQGVGGAFSAEGFNGVDGILGLGPAGLTEGTLLPAVFSTVPTVVDSAFSQGLIPSHSIAISFEPATSDSSLNGELAFGGTDESKFTGSITFTPITNTSPASEYWGIDQSISYDSTTILSTTAGIVDTGTTLLYMASDAFSAYENATGATLDETTGMLTVTSEQYGNLKDLNFTIGGAQFTLTPNAQTWPRALNTAIGGNASSIYLVVANTGDASGSGLDFINGQVFLERFYSVFDTANKQVGFATTSFTNAETN